MDGLLTDEVQASVTLPIAQNRVLQSALNCASRGWRLVPLFGLRADGKTCECSRGAECTSPGKHPRVKGWPTEATVDEETLCQWFEQWPGSNLGLKLGPDSGVVDLEFDDEEGRTAADKFLGGIVTPKYRSKRSVHYLCKWHPSLGNVECDGHGKAVRKIKGLECRLGNAVKGTQSVLPPSKHASGIEYAWLISPDDAEPADIPSALLAELLAEQNRRQNSAGSSLEDAVLYGVAEGNRNNKAAQLAGSYLAKIEDLDSEVEIDIARQDYLRFCNTTFTPRLPADELNTTFDSILESERRKRNHREHNKTPSVSFKLDDIGNARRFVARYRDRIRYCHPRGQWLIWDGTRWKTDDTGEIMRLAKQLIDSMWGELPELPEDKRAPFSKFVSSSSKRDRLKAMIELAQSEPGIPVLPEQLDQNQWLLNCPNGTIDLKTGELRPHRREDFITKLCPTNYRPAAKAPTWQEFLSKVHNSDPDVIAFIQRHHGYCCTGDVRERSVLICVGEGKNGKSTAAEIVNAVFGPDFSLTPPGNFLMKRKGEAHPTEQADLEGKRAVWCSESEDGAAINGALLKRMTGGDTIRARGMRENFRAFQPTHKLILSTNHKPEIGDEDSAVWDRVYVVPYDVQFWNPDVDGDQDEARKPRDPALQQDKTLKAKLLAESEGILAWLVKGCLEWQRIGLAPPPAVKTAMKAYRHEQDLLGGFLEARCRTGIGLETKLSAFVEEYAVWLAERQDLPGKPVVTARQVARKLWKRGFEKKVNDGTWVKGVVLLALPNGSTEETEDISG